MDTRICAHCKDKFIFSHLEYKPKVRYRDRVGAGPEAIVYCSDACLMGLDLRELASCGCNLRAMKLNDFKDKEKFICLTHYEVFDVPAIKAT